jgi:hypothetical protein
MLVAEPDRPYCVLSHEVTARQVDGVPELVVRVVAKTDSLVVPEYPLLLVCTRFKPTPARTTLIP